MSGRKSTIATPTRQSKRQRDNPMAELSFFLEKRREANLEDKPEDDPFKKCAEQYYNFANKDKKLQCQYIPSYGFFDRVWTLGMDTELFQNCFCTNFAKNCSNFVIIYMGTTYTNAINPCKRSGTKSECDNRILYIDNFAEDAGKIKIEKNKKIMINFIEILLQYIIEYDESSPKQLIISCDKGQNRSPMFAILAELILSNIHIEGQQISLPILTPKIFLEHYNDLKENYGFYSRWMEEYIGGYSNRTESFVELYNGVMQDL